MQVRLLNDETGPNPAFNPKLPQDKETNWPERDLPKGTIITSADAYHLCLVTPCLAEPVDQEAIDIVAKYRPNGLGIAAPVTIQLPEQPPANATASATTPTVATRPQRNPTDPTTDAEPPK